MVLWAMDPWAVTCSVTGDRLNKLLKKGWEPFAVADGEVWLRHPCEAEQAGCYTARDALKLGEPAE